MDVSGTSTEVRMSDDVNTRRENFALIQLLHLMIEQNLPFLDNAVYDGVSRTPISVTS